MDFFPNRRKDAIQHYLKQYVTQVAIVVMDMNPSFKVTVKNVLNRPLIVSDRCHCFFKSN